MLTRFSPDTIELPHQNDTVTPLLTQLLTLESGDRKILSAYIRLENWDRNRSAYLIALKDEVRLLQADPVLSTLTHPGREEVERDLERILGFAEHGVGRWPSPGIGVFAWEEKGVFEAVALPSVPRTRVALDQIPHVRELVAGRPAGEPILTLLTDRTHVRLFQVNYLTATELSSVWSPTTAGGRFHGQRLEAPGWGERDYHGRLNEERRLQHGRIVAAIEPLVAALTPQAILVAGPSDHSAMLIADLPRHLAKLVLGQIVLNPTVATVAEVKAATLQAAEAWRSQATTRLIRAVEDGVGRGLAVEGLQDTLRMLSRGQVRTLVAPEVPGDGGSVMEKAIEDALRHKIDVVLVHEPGLTELMDGVGALLRYR